MIAIGWTWAAAFSLLAPHAPASQECFRLVARFGSVDRVERERLQKDLVNRPLAVWAVFCGSRRPNPDIAGPCLEILEEWSWQARLSEIVQSVEGDFDRFINSLLYRRGPNVDLFAHASQQGRVFNDFFIRKSLATNPKWFSTLGLATDPRGFATPFHDFSAYQHHMKPVMIEGLLRRVPGAGPRYLAKCEGGKTDYLSHSIVLSEGNLYLAHPTWSIIVAGGDIDISDPSASLVIAAGDVNLYGHVAGGALILAGGKILVDGRTDGVLFVSPRKVERGRRGKIGSPLLVFDGKPKPVFELFTFRELADYGLEAALEQGRVKITAIKAAGTFDGLFRPGDLVIARDNNKKIESLPQFRLLLRYALDTGKLQVDIERAGQPVILRADLKKAASEQ
jgi:hypothetical protein